MDVSTISLSAGTFLDANGNAFADYDIAGNNISVAKTIVIGSTAVVKGDILFSESLKTEEGADINGYLKKTESTSLEAAQNEFKLDSIEAKESREKDKSKKGRPKIVASN